MGNKKNLIKKIEKFEKSLNILKDALKKGDSKTLKNEFIRSTKRRKEIH